MIRIVRFSEASQLRYQTFDQENRPELTDGFFENSEYAGFLVNGAEAIGYYAGSMRDSTGQLSIAFIQKIEFEQACRFLSMITEEMIRIHHPEKICIVHGIQYVHVLQANGYYQKGTYFQKKIEPWRLQLPDAVFDDAGFIIDQGRMESVPFGWFDTKRKGCGWIAAYNLLKMCGQDATMQHTAEGLARTAFLGGMFGEELYLLYFYLRRQGLNCHISASYDTSAIKCMQESRYGILLYSHSAGAHYTAWNKTKDQTYHFYNAVYGKKDHIESIESFLKKRELLPFSSVIYVK